MPSTYIQKPVRMVKGLPTVKWAIEDLGEAITELYTFEILLHCQVCGAIETIDVTHHIGGAIPDISVGKWNMRDGHYWHNGCNQAAMILRRD